MRRLFAVVLCVIALGACSSKSDDPPEASDDGLTYFTTAPPWPLADRQFDRMVAAGVPQLKSEGSVVHYHSHLDVFHDGQPVEVPANIGIDFDRQRISPLHTHQASGIIHVEANEDEEFTLGEFLTERGVRTSDTCIGDVCGADKIQLYVNGEKQSGAPVDFVIKANLQIALVLGTPPSSIPATYDCSQNPSDACDQIPQP